MTATELNSLNALKETLAVASGDVARWIPATVRAVDAADLVRTLRTLARDAAVLAGRLAEEEIAATANAMDAAERAGDAGRAVNLSHRLAREELFATDVADLAESL